MTEARRLCACGCGEFTTGFYRRTNPYRNYRKGEPHKFIHQHRVKPLDPKPQRYRGTRRNGVSKMTHICVAERALGKPLPEGAHVHHFDGDGYNNDPANLVICQDAAYHSLLHVRQRVKAAGGDPNTQRICTRCKQLKFASELVGGRFVTSNKCRECIRVMGREKYRRLRAAALPERQP